MEARSKPVRIEIIVPDDDTKTPHMTDVSVLRLARLIGRQMAREEHEHQKRRQRQARKPAAAGQKS